MKATDHADTADQKRVKDQIKVARKRIKEEDFEGARSALTSPTVDDHDEARRLLLIAEAYEGEGRFADAADCLRQARALKPDSTKIAAANLDVLTTLRNARSAVQLYESLPKRIQHKREIQWEMYWLYRQLGWHANADKSYRPLLIGPRERLIWALRRPLRPALLKVENSEREHIKARSGNLELLDRMTYKSTALRYDSHATVDSAIISYVRNDTKLEILYGILRVLFAIAAVCALIFYLLFTSKEGGLGARFAIGLICPLLIYYVGRKIWDATSTYRRAFAMTSLFGTACVTMGGLTLRLITDSEYLRLVGLAFASGGILIIMAGLGNLLYVSFEAYRQQRITRRNARGAAIDRLADLIIDIDDNEKRDIIAHRRSWVWRLESVAQLLERDVAKNFARNDEHARSWLQTQCTGAAASLRQMKLTILAPSDKSWGNLSRLLRQQLIALTTGNWGNLAVRKPANKPVRRSWTDRLLSAARLTAIAFFPAIGLFAVSPWVDFGDAALKWARVAAFGWAILSILFALDPALREKLQAMRNIAGTAVESDDKRRDSSSSGKRGESAGGGSGPPRN